jgi:NDP-sugar pyrophosphorylase family protein
VTAVVHRERAPGAAPTPGGVYVFDRRVLDHIPRGGFQDIKENLIPRLHRLGVRVVAYHSEGFCPHVFDAQTYLLVNQWMVQRLFDQGEVLLHPDAVVDPGARLVGPVQLGAGTRVEAGATVVGPTSIGSDCLVGRNALVARSVVWSRCLIGGGSVVHGSVIGNDGVIPPAARMFNVVRPPRTTTASPRAEAGTTAVPVSGPPASVSTSCPLG